MQGGVRFHFCFKMQSEQRTAGSLRHMEREKKKRSCESMCPWTSVEFDSNRSVKVNQTTDALQKCFQLSLICLSVSLFNSLSVLFGVAKSFKMHFE